MNAGLEQIYDGFAETYEKNRCLFDMTDVFDSFFDRLKMERGSLLDLGCGSGEPFARFFSDRGWTVTGVDFSQRMLDLAKRHVPAMTTIHADMQQVEFEPEQFDAAVAVYSLFHVPAEGHAALLRKCCRWLRPGGKMLFTYASRQFTGHEEFDGFISFLGKELYYSHKRPERLQADVEEAGFRIEAWELRKIGNETFLWITASKPA